jgi:hypothetical protein
LRIPLLITGWAEAHLYRPGTGLVAHLPPGFHPDAGFPAGEDFDTGNRTGQQPATDHRQTEGSQPQAPK